MDNTRIFELIDITNVRLSSLKEVESFIDRIFSIDTLQSYVIKQSLFTIIFNDDYISLRNDIIDGLINKVKVQPENFLPIGIAHILDILSDVIKAKKLSHEQVFTILQEINDINCNIFNHASLDINYVAIVSSIKLCRRCLKYFIGLMYRQQILQWSFAYSHFIEISKICIQIVNSCHYPSFVVNKILDFIFILTKVDTFKFKSEFFMWILKSLYDLSFLNIKFHSNIKLRNTTKISKYLKKKYKRIYQKDTANFYKKNLNKYYKIKLDKKNYGEWPLMFLTTTTDQQIFIGKQASITVAVNTGTDKILLNKITLQKYILLFMSTCNVLVANSGENKIICNYLILFENFLSSLDCSSHDEMLAYFSSEYQFESNLNKLISIFASQDDFLIHILLLILQMQDCIQENSILNANVMFVDFLRFLNFDWSVLLDFLISPETKFLQYFLLQLKHINSSPQSFKAFFMDNKLDSNFYIHLNRRYCEREIKLQIFDNDRNTFNKRSLQPLFNKSTINQSNYKLTAYSDSESEDFTFDSKSILESDFVESNESNEVRKSSSFELNRHNRIQSYLSQQTNMKYYFNHTIKCLNILKEKLELNLKMQNPLIPYNVTPLIKQLSIFQKLIAD